MCFIIARVDEQNALFMFKPHQLSPPPSSPIFAAMLVAVALPLPRLAPLTYTLHDHQLGGIGSPLGCRVLVPLGKRIVTGTVVQTDAPFTKQTRDVIEVLDERPAFSPTMLKLTRWMADYYLCSWGEALQAALPSGLTPQSLLRVHVEARLDDNDLLALERRAPKRAALLRLLQGQDGPLTLKFIERKLKSASVADQLEALQRDGLIRVQSEMEHEAHMRRVQAVAIAEHLVADDVALRTVMAQLDTKAPKQSAVLAQLYLAQMHGDTPVPRAQLQHRLGASPSAVDALVAKGLATIAEVSVSPQRSEQSLVQRNESDVALTNEQQQIVDHLTARIQSRERTPFVLEGVTGSGKTIVYLHAIRQALSMGMTALVLVPEIALTPQLSDRFRAVFGSDVAVLHSRMNLGQRADTWRNVRDGKARVVLGPRSAVLAPMDNLGVIIVDEEHEPSYKQEDPAPRYNGRDVAVMRAHIEGCAIILGSATPSLETRWNVAQSRYHHGVLHHRADGAVLPTIQLVDLRSERKTKTMVGGFAASTLHAIERAITRREGVLVFLNRRGFAGELQCKDCGEVPTCRNCDVSLTYHKASASMRCHYCGYLEPFHTACATCGSVAIDELGIGTQRVEEDLRQWLSSRGMRSTVERMDADTTTRRGSHRRILERFAAGDIDVLVGTQMIAKGLDLARVSLVVIVNADQSLYHSDFRASERTYQLLVQVAGRAGRTGAVPGTVIVQTSAPSHPAIQAAVTGHLHQWLDQELAERAAALYPPYARFITLDVKGAPEANVERAAQILTQLMPESGPGYIRLPAVPPPIAKLRGQWRRVIVVKNDKATDPSGAQCRAILRGVHEAYHRDFAVAGVRVSIDVDA